MRASARLLLLALVVSGCASVAPMDVALRQSVPSPAIRFGVDTFAFPNESSSKNAGKPDLYANYCFVMTRAVVQFHRFARFDPTAPKLGPETYTARVRQVVARSPWEDALPPDDRVVVSGYTSLFRFSRAQQAAVKEGLVTRPTRGSFRPLSLPSRRVLTRFTGRSSRPMAT